MLRNPTVHPADRTPTEDIDRFSDALGVACVIAGGLTAAMAGPLKITKGSWLAAYLVLVCGVGQCVLSRQDEMLGLPSRDRDRSWVRPAAWTAGNALVVLGALASRPFVADAGGVVLLGGLILAGADTRGATRRRPAAIVRVVYGLLGVSVPIGLTLTHLRS